MADEEKSEKKPRQRPEGEARKGGEQQKGGEGRPRGKRPPKGDAEAAAAQVEPEPEAAVAAAAPTETPVVAPDEAEAGPSPDEAYVETARCSSCNECIQINPKLFAYDENKQCRIVNLDAGTYRDLVEAAENCQLAIIHPGKPRNPNEPGLDELLKRAEPFR